MSDVLPPGFEDLAPFLGYWNQPDCQARFVARFESDMDGIRSFYDAITPRADAALAELERFEITALPPAHQNLYGLLMSLAHVAVAVERYGQPRPKSVTWPTTLTVTQGIHPA
ncbi:hypothetical protein U5A82_15860 [Sphingobium sp. CR2-8]|uniref:hypothetical protein n=1 Tax=Sphingobium sp. CR2-8 TaxID=1306534 RepID=UPI002DB8399A|nr:hypothetical protein [Sphingobium sp. CR2-8]MEC3911891.1 hypothetical protein [Sphingobium sp. CR2-8]